MFYDTAQVGAWNDLNKSCVSSRPGLDQLKKVVSWISPTFTIWGVRGGRKPLISPNVLTLPAAIRCAGSPLNGLTTNKPLAREFSQLDRNRVTRAALSEFPGVQMRQVRSKPLVRIV